MGVVSAAELEGDGVEETRLDSVVEADASPSDEVDVTIADGRDEAGTVDSCERSEGRSSWRRTAGWGAAVTECRQRIKTMHTTRKRNDLMAKCAVGVI